jgi:hypothetical protein
MGTKIEAPVPGVYENVPFETYLAWDAVSQSQLKDLLRSPAHLQVALAAPDEDTDALRIGRAAHCAVLEAPLFGTRYARLPEGFDGRTKAGKELRESIDADGRTALKAAEYDAALAIAATVGAHPSASAVLYGEGGRNELSLVWVDEETGLICKARHDRHSPLIAGGAIADLKTTQDASAREFERSIFTFGYHRQGAFYLRGAKAHELEAEHFVIVAVEKEAPFAASVYRLTEGAIAAGDAELSALLARYDHCRRSGQWPAYPTDVRDIGIPDWAWGASQRMADAMQEALLDEMGVAR